MILVTQFLPSEEMSNEAKAITIDQYGSSLVAVNFRSGSSIAHEAVHIKNAIWRYIGYEPQRDNDDDYKDGFKLWNYFKED